MDGKVVLITGSSRGIGAAVARLAKSQGAEVILNGREESGELLSIAKELDAQYIVCDVSDKTAVQNAVTQLLQSTPRIDALVNCAGIVLPKPFLELKTIFG